MAMRILLMLLRFIGILLVIIVLFILAIIIPIDHTPYREKPFYGVMMSRLDSLKEISIPHPQHRFETGFAKSNITPVQRTATAGYGKRIGKKFSSVLDSIYVRAIVITNGNQKVAIVSADLLIIPPEVTERLNVLLPTIGYSLDNTYLNAIHTHNSIGNWGKGATRLLYGAYSDSIVNFISDKIATTIKTAERDLKPSSIKSGSIGVPDIILNRVDKEHGKIDSLLHLVEITRADSSKVAMVTFNAHATCLFSKDLQLSRDYPGALVDQLEQKGYAFAMFLSGAVGSHGCKAPEFGEPCIDFMADKISEKIEVIKPHLQPVVDSTLAMVRVPLELGEPQVKVSEDWRVRPWVFKAAFGEYQPYFTGLKVGNIVFVGTPCDYSGELTAPLRKAAAKGSHVIVTSFNGEYVGYITADQHYNRSHYETRLMNWYGPGNGDYFVECLTKVVDYLSN